MAIITKAPKIMAESLSAKAGTALWNILGPHTKKKIITSSLAIITQAAARSLFRKTGPVLLIGIIIAGAVFIVNSQDRD